MVEHVDFHYAGKSVFSLYNHTLRSFLRSKSRRFVSFNISNTDIGRSVTIGIPMLK